MKVIVITGSTRGLGLGLAGEFLKRGCAVVVSGRTPAAVDNAVQQLSTGRSTEQSVNGGADRVLGQPCDVTVYGQVQSLWEAARGRFGRVDVWINCAGLAHADIVFWDQPPERYPNVVMTNVVGTMYGCRVALTGMLAQGGGAIYNVEGFGSRGRLQHGLSIYGSTKAAIHFLTRSLQLEAKDLPVMVGAISPGMLITDLLIGQYQGRPAEWERAKRVFNALADRVETVAPFVADKVLTGETPIIWLTPAKVMYRLLVARFKKRDLFEEAGKT